MASRTTKRKKKAPPKKKRQPAPRRPTLTPALLFLLLTAGLLGVLYLLAGKHLPTRNSAAVRKTPALIRPEKSNSHRQPARQHKKGHQSRPTPQPASKSSKLIVYRLSQDFSQLIKSPVIVNKNLTDRQKVQSIIELLTRPSQFNQAPLARGTRMRSVAFKTPSITIDLSADIRNNLINSGANDEIMAVACLSNSLLINFPRYSSVQILIDGKKCRTLAGHIDISRPLSYQTGINVKTD